MNYSDSQSRAIRHKDGPMLVLAGPGSGKTAVVTQRTRHLITECGVNPGHILVITYTRAAAKEMEQRFLQLMGTDKSWVTFGTFHKVFFMVLRMAYHYTGANIIREEQRYGLLRESLSRHHLEYRNENEFIDNLLGEIGKVKNERIPLEHFYSTQCGESTFREIFKEYERALKERRLIDFDDMLLYTYELFSERGDILSAWQKKYAYILVDEFQDINPLQWEILQMLAAPRNNLFAVGDDDQSIYRFRGARPEIMQSFPKVYPGCGQILLENNFRSDGYIVSHALGLIGCNKQRFAKAIRPVRPAKEPVRFLAFPTQREENLAIIRDIRQGIACRKNYGDYAVLFRTNTQMGLLSEQLVEQNIPFRMRERIPNLYEHWIARDILAYVRLAQGSRSRADFLQIMNRPNRYIGRDSLVEETVAFDVWQEYYRQQPWIAERIENLAGDLKALQRMSPFAAVNYIRCGIGYEAYLKEYAAYRHVDPEELLEVLEALLASARAHKTFQQWREHMARYTEELKWRERRGEQEDGVVLATYHSAKGLEFDSVYLADVCEELIPYKKAVLEQDIEEERRLFYVGMTRAKNFLTVCTVASLGGKKAEESRFVAEAREVGKISYSGISSNRASSCSSSKRSAAASYSSVSSINSTDGSPCESSR